jgi:hypothetical protein
MRHFGTKVLDGQYVDCGISLGIKEFSWSNNPLCIDSAEISFARKAVQQKQTTNQAIEKSSVAQTKRWWAVILVFAAAATWCFPRSGRIFDASSDVTTGEGRIVAAVMLVGGLLLWFLGEP